MRDIPPRFKAILGLIQVEPDTARADQRQIGSAIADQVGQLPLGVEKLDRQRGK